MIKYKGLRNGRPFVGVAISAGNVQRLTEGKPIVVKGAEIGIDFDILIHYGETEAAILKELSDLGVLQGALLHKADGAA